MTTLTRWFAPAVIAAGLAVVGVSPAPARAQSSDDWVRVIVDIADVIYHSGYPYYRYGHYGYNDRLIVVPDHYGRHTYYRNVPRDYRYGPPYGKAHGYRRHDNRYPVARCDPYGRCTTRYYDARYDNRYYDNRYYGYDRYDRYRYGRDRYWNGVRWRDRGYDYDD